MKRLYKFTTFLILVFIMIALVKFNVTATRENKSITNSSVKTLEISSEIVQNIYSKLVFLEDDFLKDDIYRNSYFKIKDEKKIISNEDKLYIALNSLYKKNIFEKENNDDGTITVSINKEKVYEEIFELFIDDNFELVEPQYTSSIGCGIISQSYEEDVYKFIIKKCNTENEISKVQLVGAEKEGNFINLKVKSFIASREKNKKGDYTEVFVIKNYNSDEILDKLTFEEINTNSEKIFKENDIDEYILSFKLKGDKYSLTSVHVYN